MKLKNLLPTMLLALGMASASAQSFNTASNPSTGYTAGSLSSQPIPFSVYTGASTVTPGAGGTFGAAVGNSGFYYTTDAAATTGQTVTESATLTLGSDSEDNIYGGGSQYGVVNLELWSGPNAASGTSIAVLALKSDGGTSYDAQINGTNENSALTIGYTDTLVFTIVDQVGGGGSGQDALTATITDNGTTIYTTTLNVATSSDGAYSYRMLNGPTTLSLTNLALGVSSGSGSAFAANFTSAQGYVNGSLSSSTQTGAPYFTLTGTGDLTVNASAGTATNSIPGPDQKGAYATYTNNTGTLGAAGTVYTVTTNFVLGTGDFDDSAYGGYGPEAYMSSGAVASIYSQSVGTYRFITDSGNDSIGIPSGITSDTFQIKIAETVNSNGTLAVVDTLTDLTSNTVIDTTTGTLAGMSNQTAGFSGVYDPTAAFSSFTTSWGGTGAPPPSAPVITSATSASGSVGTAFSYAITATNSPTSYSVSGTLPDGLSLNSSTGVISGTPSSDDNTTVTINATNSTGTGSASLALTITSGTFNTANDPATGYTNGSLSDQPISFSVYTGASTVTAGSGGTFESAVGRSGFYYTTSAPASEGETVTESATLSLGSDAQDNIYGGGPQNGVVNLELWSGPDAASGTLIAVLALKSDGGTSYDAQINGTSEGSSLTINPSDTLVFTIVDSVGTGTSGQDALTATITDNGTTIYTATLDVATSSDGAYSYRMLNGPTTLSLTNLALGVTGTATGGAPVITSSSSASGTVGTAFSYAITASNSPTSYGVSGSLPSGLSLNSSTGVISGTPTAASSSTVTISATNSSGTGSASLTFSISGGGSAPVITSSQSVSGTTGSSFSYQITASNSPTSYSESGTLPSGLSLNSGNGVISGTPTTPGAVAVTITASNSAGSDSEQLIFVIASPGMVSTTGGANNTPGMINDAVAVGTIGQSFTYQAKATNAYYFLPPYQQPQNPNQGPVTTFTATGLPAGLSIVDAESSEIYPASSCFINTWEGVVTGTPTGSPGAYSATITATNPSGSTTVPLLIVLRAPTTSGTYYTTYEDSNGVWWFKDPTGHLMVLKGMDEVVNGPVGSQAGSPLDASLLVSDNINTLGAFSEYSFIPIPGTTKNIAYTDCLNISNSTNSFPDVFSSGFTSEWNSGAAQACGQYSSDHSVLGWYSDNELNWGSEWTPGNSNEDKNSTVSSQLLWSWLGATSSATYSHAISFLQNEYGGSDSTALGNLNASWQTNFTSWSQLGQGGYSSSNSIPSHTGVYNDCNNFAALLATQYFSVTSAAIKAADPNHLLLGCKYTSTSHPLPGVVTAEVPYVDVITIDCYQSDSGVATPVEDVQFYNAATGSAKPIIVGEFSFCSVADNNSNCGNADSAVNESDQEGRATGFAAYVQAGLNCKTLAGYCWFLAVDFPSDCNYGITDMYNNPYEQINSQMATTNAEAESLHASANQ